MNTGTQFLQQPHCLQAPIQKWAPRMKMHQSPCKRKNLLIQLFKIKAYTGNSKNLSDLLIPSAYIGGWYIEVDWLCLPFASMRLQLSPISISWMVNQILTSCMYVLVCQSLCLANKLDLIPCSTIAPL